MPVTYSTIRISTFHWGKLINLTIERLGSPKIIFLKKISSKIISNFEPTLAGPGGNLLQFNLISYVYPNKQFILTI